MAERIHRENASSQRRTLRSKNFWDIRWSESDDEDIDYRKFTPKVKNWAESVEESEREEQMKMKTDKRDKQPEGRFNQEKKTTMSFKSYMKFNERRESSRKNDVSEKAHRKRERNSDSSLKRFSVENHPDFVKRRMRTGSDGISTTSSSMNSSDNEQEETRERKVETDPVILSRRQKQIDYGKNTKAYRNYLQLVPKYKRTDQHICTPKKHDVYSRRSWDNLIKIWRKALHQYDPESDQEEDADVDLSEMVSMIESK